MHVNANINLLRNDEKDASRVRRVTNSFRMFCSVPRICEFGTFPSSDWGKLDRSRATHVGMNSPLSSLFRISRSKSFRSLIFLSMLRPLVGFFSNGEKKALFFFPDIVFVVKIVAD